MLFRVLLCLIYLITLEISVAASFEHNNDSNILNIDFKREPQNMLYINNLSAIQIIEDFQQYYDLKKEN